MTITELITALEGIAEPGSMQAVVRCLDEEFDIDAIRVESFAGNENEPTRTVLAIRIEPLAEFGRLLDGER